MTTPLGPSALLRTEDEARFTFTSTAELAPLHEPIGQTRALEALRFGVGVRRDGYNIVAIGPIEAGKWTLVRELLEQVSAQQAVPRDVCYVHDFRNPQTPMPLLLPPGRAVRFRKDVAHLVEELRAALPAAFESEEFRSRKAKLEDELKSRQEKKLLELKRHAEERDVGLVRTPMGFMVAPMMGGEVISPEVFEKFPEERRQAIEASMEAIKAEMSEALEDVPRLEREVRRRMRELVRQVASLAVRHLVEELTKEYADLPEVQEYLALLQGDVLENVDDFLKPSEAPSAGPAEPALLDLGPGQGLVRLRRYQVNVLVDHSASKGAPVIFEDHPSYANLVGRIEHISQFGALLTDFNLIKPGSLHRANGGYLALDARQLLREPHAWEGLKRALLSRELRIESLAQALSLATTTSLEPGAIPLDVKVVLLADRHLYYLLEQFEPDLARLFKVVADFEDRVERSEETVNLFARLVGTIAAKEQLRDLDPSGVARVVERCARLAERADKLSTHRGELTDMLREADYCAGSRGSALITGDDVERSVAALNRREGRIRERLLEETAAGTYLIDTTGSRVGQVNGLAVLAVGRSVFGRPARITARVRLGQGEVVDVEREVALGGPTHAKGVLILSAFLGARYGADQPLSLHATLVFEQSYGLVDGDSASTAELCALLSALAEVPLRQSMAITGSVNQHGEVQAIGGVNEKIEGFFDLCAARGLTGEQGVIIPAANVAHLMLRRDVVEGAAAGRFSVWPVHHVDEAIGLLTGIEVGARTASGRFPDGSLHQRVETRLQVLARRRADALRR